MGSPSVTLVVDDDAIARFLTCRLLQQAQPPGPVLVLVDINMPVMNGIEFLRYQQAFSSSHRELMTTVLVSSSATAADQQRAQALTHAYVTKPLTPPVLCHLMQQHLASCELAGAA